MLTVCLMKLDLSTCRKVLGIYTRIRGLVEAVNADMASLVPRLADTAVHVYHVVLT